MQIKTLKILTDKVNSMSAGDISNAVRFIVSAEKESGQWQKYGLKLANWIDGGMQYDDIPLTVLAIGNSKLPFLAFSSLSLASCPGAGDCKDYCYSITAWRYPAAYFRQLQNYIIELYRPEFLARKMADMLNRPKFKKLERVDFRLYVDGDFSSPSVMSAWFTILENNPKLKAYGYSKSLAFFASYPGKFPSNYLLNVSNGSIYDNDQVIQDKVETLSIYREKFIAVDAPKGDRRAILAKLGKKAFICPGKCGECTVKNGHACGSEKFKGVTIALAIH